MTGHPTTMSPHPMEPEAIISPDGSATSQPRINNNEVQSSSDGVDVVLKHPQPHEEERASNASVEPQTSVSQGISIPANIGATPRFKLGVRGSENDFIFAPAPRHAPGHFTHRKIVPRIDGMGTDNGLSYKPSSNGLSTERQTGATHNSPARDATHSRTVQFPSAAPSPLSLVRTENVAHKQSPPPKKIGLPFAQTRPIAISKGESQSSTKMDQQLPVDVVQNDQPKDSHRSPLQPAQSLASGEYRTASNDMEIHSPPTSNLRSSIKEGASSGLAAENLRVAPRQRLEVIMEQSEGEEPTMREGDSNRDPLVGRPQQPTLEMEAQSNGLQNLKQWTRDNQATRLKRAKQNHQMSRPVRLVHQGRDNSRSSSVTSSASGVSKRKARSIRNLNVFRDRDLPEVANKVNDLWKLCNDAVKEAETDSQYKVDKYRRKLFEKSQRLASYLETIKAQAHAIDNLEGQIQEMNSYIEKLKQQVRVYSEKVPVLMDNCRILKSALDSTIEEHKQHQKSSQDVIEEIRTEKQREQSARELVERQLAAVREHMKERVHQVEVHCQEECRRVNEKMQLLTQQVHEKDSQIQRERVMADQLSKQLEEYQQAQSSLEDLRAQTSDIVKMLNERHANDYVEQLKLTQVESRANLDNITKHLESLRGLIVPQSDGVSTLGDKQAEGISRIMATLKTMYEAQSDSKEAMKQLGKDLRDHVDGMWQHLKPREEALTQQLEEKRSENEVLRSVIDEREKERQLLKQQLEKANDARQAQEERIEELVRKVCQLKAQPQEDPEGRVGLQALTRENDDLKAQLAVKCSSIASFKTQLDAKNESYVADVASFGKEIKRLTQLLNDREESSKSATKKTLTTVQEDHQAKLQRLEVDMRSRLQLAEKDRQLVLDQLDETRKKLEVAEQLRHNEPSNTNALLRAALDEAELRNQKLVEDLKQKEAEVENDKTHFASLWNWAGSKAEAHGFDVDKIWKDAQEAGGPAKRWTCFLESILARIDMHGAPPGETPPAGITAPHELDKSSSHARFMPGVSGLSQPRFLTQVAAGNGNDGDGQVSQQNFHLRPPGGLGGMLGGEPRRVTVRSPHSGVLTPVPPSVEQEKARRRGNQQQPKPIMKRLTRSSAHADELRLGQDLVSASILPPGFGSLGNPFARSTETDEKEEIGIGRGDDPSGGFRSGETQGAVAGSGQKTKLKNAKRSRKTTEAEPVEPFSADPPKTDLVDDDDDVPQMKRAKVHKQKTPASSRRAKVTASRPKKQLSGLAAQGVVYGSFPAGVVHGGPIPPSEVTNKP